MEKRGFVYLIVSLLTALFGAVYERFSHEVYSGFMLYSFLFPLAGGALPCCGLALYGRRYPGRAAWNLYNSGIATLTTGSILEGVLKIYGTTNDLLRVYWVLGTALTVLGLALYLADRNGARPRA